MNIASAYAFKDTIKSNSNDLSWDFSINNILKISPKKVVYISCNPASLMRDLHLLEEKYDIKRVKAMDSAFTFPPQRLDELINILLDENIEWEAYSRADVITTEEKIKFLEAAKCRLLSIGFESLSDDTLKKMNKRITAEQNRRANDLLNKHAQEMDFRGSFIVGFPGGTPEDFKLTHDFLVNEYKKQFQKIHGSEDIYKLHILRTFATLYIMI